MTAIHLHTDNYWFSGSETTLLVLAEHLFDDPAWATSFSYVAWPEYEPGFRAVLPGSVRAEPVDLLDPLSLRLRLSRGRGEAATRAARVAVRILPSRRVSLVSSVRRMGQLLRAVRPEVLHVNNGGFPGAISCNAAALAGRRAGVPVTVYVVNNLAQGYRRPSRWADWPVDRRLASTVTRFVTGSAAAAQVLREMLGRAAVVEVLPNTIREAEPDESPEQTRARLGLRDGARVVLVAARLEARKGHRHLFDAVSRLCRDRSDLDLDVVVAGEGPEHPVLAAQLRELELEGSVRLVGPQRNIWDLLAVADLLVLPSVGFEDFPIVVLEAMRAGRPVVASRVAGVPEQVVHGETGIVVAPGDPAALAMALARILDDERLAASMGRAARQRYDMLYTPAAAIARYDDLYRRLLEQG